MKLLLVGDVMLGRLVNRVLKTEPPEYPWGDTLPIFRSADLRICNLECVISDRGRPWSTTPKVFHFRSDAKNIESLTAAGIDVVSIANNHTLDYEYEAFFDMLAILKANSIGFAGAGMNAAEASMPFVREVTGPDGTLRVAFIACTDNQPEWEAEERKPGIFYVPIEMEDSRAQRLFDIVERTKKELADLVIVSAHWGPNWGYAPLAQHIAFGRRLIDTGADIIHGHSAHIFRGIEIYRGRPIFYSMGDFVDDYAVDEIERNDESFIFVVETGKEPKSIRLYPTIISEFQARMAVGRRAEIIAGKMQKLCQSLNTPVEYYSGDAHLEIQIR